jgi:DNA polymerase III subunit gamma/tau
MVSQRNEALALKYRPANFEQLIGQESVSQTLSLAIDTDRVSHAYLFSGLRGSGKTSTARIFSKALLCERGQSSRPCGVCESCVMARESRHMDIIEMDAASNRGIDDIRALIEQTKYKPAIGRYKIFIIDEVHMLTPPAFNALLKTLEEPPDFVKFILATTDPLKLPATILSRTQHFRFKHISTQDVAHHLAHILNEENIEYEPDALGIVARSGGGSLRDSLTLLDQAIIYSKGRVDVVTVTNMLGLVDPKTIADIFKAVLAKDRGALIDFIKMLEAYEVEIVVDEMIAYLKERMLSNDTQFSTLLLDRFFRVLADAKQLLVTGADGGFVLSLLLFKFVEALKVQEINTMIESLQKDVEIPPVAQHHEKPAVQQQPSTDTATMQESAQDLFEKLIARISDRSAEIGECFKKNIRFISFEEGVLQWESCADEECKKALRHGFSVIKQLVREIFGFETQIKNIPCSEPMQEEEPQQIQNAGSMVEENELSGGSCVSNCLDDAQEAKEHNGADILEEPLVKKSIELFEVTKVTIQSKV